MEAEKGPGHSGLARDLLKTCTDSVKFWNSKVRSPVQLDPATEEGQLDVLNREYSASLFLLISGLSDYVAAHHPDGLKWRYDKAQPDKAPSTASKGP